MQVSPYVAMVLKRLNKNGFLTTASNAPKGSRLGSQEDIVVRLLVKNGWPLKFRQNGWEPTSAGRAVDVSNAAIDHYEVLPICCS